MPTEQELHRGRVLLLCLTVGVNALGTGAFYAFALLFFSAVSSLPLAQVGTVLAVTALVVLPLVPQVGLLIDRVGARVVLALANLGRCTCFLVLLLRPGLVGFAVLCAVVALLNRAEQSCTPPLVAAVAGASRTRPVQSAVRFALTVGMGGGALLGAVVIARSGYDAVGLLNAISFAVATVLAVMLPSSIATPARTGSVRSAWAGAWHDRDYRPVMTRWTVQWAIAITMEMAVPVYAVETLGLPALSIGVLFGVCAVVLIVAQPAVPWLLDRIGDERAVRVGLGLYAAVPVGCLVSLAAHRQDVGPTVLTGLLVVAMILHACGELLVIQVLGEQLAEVPPADRRGEYTASTQVAVGVVMAAVPAAVGTVLGGPAGWAIWVAALAAVIGAVAVRGVRPPAVTS